MGGEVMSEPSFEYKGVEYSHTTGAWSVKTNRHTSTCGREWGWIEGPLENVCWGPNSLARADASEIARIHNEWLEAQKPVSIRLVEAYSRLRTEKANYERAS